MPTCQQCGEEFDNWVRINGKNRNLQNRKYCLECSPFAKHRTRLIIEQIMNCETCGKELEGNQTKYCSSKCKLASLQSYEAQQERGYIRKLQLIEMSGGACVRCGYQKNIAALTFHHLNPEDKSFAMDLRSLSNRTWESCLEEFKKCILLCANCHLEEHNPDAIKVILLRKYSTQTID